MSLIVKISLKFTAHHWFRVIRLSGNLTNNDLRVSVNKMKLINEIVMGYLEKQGYKSVYLSTRLSANY